MTSDDMREAIVSGFGKPPIDRYGSSEVGQIAASCPDTQRHHITSELVLLEVLDANDRPVAAGDLGRIVVTPLYNFAMPLIRYDIGDFGSVSAHPCACGRSLPILERIAGRTRNVFRFVDGTSTWPVLLSREINGFVPIQQFQVVQLTYTEVELRYVPGAEPRAPDLPGLTAYMHAKLHPSLTVQLREMTSIPRSPGGKFEDCMSLVV